MLRLSYSTAACPASPHLGQWASFPGVLPCTVVFLQYVNHKASYNSILVWKDEKDPLGEMVMATYNFGPWSSSRTGELLAVDAPAA